jgi:acyl-CoA dehydrogenase
VQFEATVQFEAVQFEATERQRALAGTVRAFVAERIIPLEDARDPDVAELEPEVLAELVEETKEMGLHNLDVPAEYGGPGVDTVTWAMLAMEMSQHRAGLYAPCFGAFGGTGISQLYSGSDEQKEKYLYPVLRGEKRAFFGLTEASGGSDPAASIQTTAVPDGSGWLINGGKLWITDAHRADFGLVFARTGEPGSGRTGISCFIVETSAPGFEVVRLIPTLRRGAVPTELRFTNLRVGQESLLGTVGGGFSHANDALTRTRIPYAAGCVGVAMKAQSLALDYVKKRSVFGSTLADHEGIQWMLVDNELDIRTATLLTLHAASRADRGLAYRTEAAVAKTFASEAGGRVVDRAMQLFGALGVSADLPFERWYREMRIRRIGEGSSETQRMIISRELLKRDAYQRPWEG